jgi:hypothetical protein
MNVLDDGTIVPSYLGIVRPERVHDTGVHTNVALHVGEVKEIVYPTDERSISKKRIEYVVLVEHSKESSAMVQAKYGAMPTGSVFGGVADFTHYTLRADPEDLQQEAHGMGSKVLLACINGRINNCIILGGIPDPKSPNDSEDDGHNFVWQFNGINLTVNDDGEVTVTRNGPSTIKGELRDGEDSSKQGGAAQLDKDGNFNVTVPTKVYLKSAGVQTGDATDATVLGDTYRNAEGQMHQKVAAALSSASGAVGGAVAGIATAGTQLGLGNNAGAAAALATVSTALGQMASQLANAAAAIQAFEAQASWYLSTKNKSD